MDILIVLLGSSIKDVVFYASGCLVNIFNEDEIRYFYSKYIFQNLIIKEKLLASCYWRMYVDYLRLYNWWYGNDIKLFISNKQLISFLILKYVI